MKKLILIKAILLLFALAKIDANSIYKQQSKNPSYFMQMLRPSDDIKNQFASNNTRINGDSPDMSVISHIKKQNVNRVSQKQYEVINMLWRKTKIFVDIETSTASYQPRHKTIPRKFYSITKHRNPLQLSLSRPMPQISTPSYIEFYYIHEIDERVKEKKSPSCNIDIKIASQAGLKNNTELVANKTLHGFSNFYKHSVITPHQRLSHNNWKQKENINFIYYVDFFTHKKATLFNKSKPNVAKTGSNNKYHQEKVTSLDTLFGNETCPYTTLQDDEVTLRNKDTVVNTINVKSHHTKQLQSNIRPPEENKNNYERLLLEHVDPNTRHDYESENKTKHFKKHIAAREKNTNDIQNKHMKQDPKLNTMLLNVKMNNDMKCLNISPSDELNAELANRKLLYDFVNRSVSWSEYRFLGVYVYEPLQVHCDAAGISPHWLITAGSCLARHHKNPGGDGLSAYVTYCGDNWWNPERVSYVKYSLVHPRYHPRNRIRRHLYNIGIIQVVNSMVSACPGWSPVSLMSHHFSASGGGARATAIGWGLDSKARQLEDEGGVRNVYCLALPPYNGEENDPIHGGLLMVGEKLIALYLQEERRPWGEQSALYTGTWRLVPWVLDNARESEESDIFTVDI
ncbi:uncharacterized protein LOC115444684 isoform X2 [Manduca sexta]|uniref:Peptidase S1 domain-containing protein n=1 Tax=Manduca sexta TaxID=7130 RepID=A0A921Z5Q7_MANSE|nr:uncharacterized protein LOC115444684 isoform X2 [Manduca sexta]KAG6451887.1 hypothetical protein O3G_MSEX007339 [Manduca sexta]